jgi:MYXO-CTERM domain-containing protein
MQRLFFVVTLLVLCCLAMPSRANGRFPRAQAILTPPGDDGSTVYLRATFGLLRSTDRGRSWRWTCEEAMGFSGTWDPPVALGRRGVVWIGLENGLRRATDGCAFAEIPELAGQTVRDLTTEPSGSDVAAVTSAAKQFTYVWRTEAGMSGRPEGDAGAASKLKRLGAGVDGVVALTIEIAPSKPSRVYLTAQSVTVPDARLFRSDDGGVTLRELRVPMPTEPGEEPGRLFVSAVDPNDPDRVIFRRLTNKASEIVLSTDGGATLKTVLRMESAFFGFSKAPDGATYYAGSGVPRDGVFVSRDRGTSWQPLSKTGVLCLLATGKALLACNNTGPGDLLSESIDGGRTFATISRLADIEPASCAICQKPWPQVRAVLRPDLGDGGSAAVEAIVDATVARASDAGTSPTIAPTIAPAATGARDGARKGGCGCGVPTSDARTPAWGLLAAAMGALTRIRQDPRRSR